MFAWRLQGHPQIRSPLLFVAGPPPHDYRDTFSFNFVYHVPPRRPETPAPTGPAEAAPPRSSGPAPRGRKPGFKTHSGDPSPARRQRLLPPAIRPRRPPHAAGPNPPLKPNPSSPQELRPRLRLRSPSKPLHLLPGAYSQPQFVPITGTPSISANPSFRHFRPSENDNLPQHSTPKWDT